VLVHGSGGPGSFYLNPLAALATGRPVVSYDQLGTGRSDHPADTTFWAVPRLVEELEQLRKALGLRQFHLFGHSGGTSVAVEYLRAHPAAVRSLVLSGPALDDSLWAADFAGRRAAMGDSLVAIFERHEREGSCDAPEYDAAFLALLRRWHARRLPWSADLDSSMASYRVAMAGYHRLGGPSCAFPDTSVPGLIDELDRITVPTLFVAGEFDYATSRTLKEYQRRVRGSQLVMIPGSGHLTSHDRPADEIRAIAAFLRGVEHP
jgi:proline iminopeptidase